MARSRKPRGPSREVRIAAAVAADELRPVVDGADPRGLMAVTVAGVTLKVPPLAMGLLVDALDDIAAGIDSVVAPADLGVGTTEIGRMLGVTPTWAAKLIDRGDIPSTTTGTKRRVRLADLAAYSRTRTSAG